MNINQIKYAIIIDKFIEYIKTLSNYSSIKYIGKDTLNFCPIGTIFQLAHSTGKNDIMIYVGSGYDKNYRCYVFAQYVFGCNYLSVKNPNDTYKINKDTIKINENLIYKNIGIIPDLLTKYINQELE